MWAKAQSVVSAVHFNRSATWFPRAAKLTYNGHLVHMAVTYPISRLSVEVDYFWIGDNTPGARENWKNSPQFSAKSAFALKSQMRLNSHLPVTLD
jgi:hypothetical protein